MLHPLHTAGLSSPPSSHSHTPLHSNSSLLRPTSHMTRPQQSNLVLYIYLYDINQFIELIQYPIILLHFMNMNEYIFWISIWFIINTFLTLWFQRAITSFMFLTFQGMDIFSTIKWLKILDQDELQAAFSQQGFIKAQKDAIWNHFVAGCDQD